LVRTKKLRKVKIQMLPESGDDRSPSPESGEHVSPDQAKIAGFRQDTSGPGQIRPDSIILAGSRQDPVRSGRISSRIQSYPAEFRSFWPDSTGSVSGSGHIRLDPDHFGQIRPDQCPDLVISGRIPAILARSGRISVRIRSNQAEFRPVSVHDRIPARFRWHSAQLPDVAGFRQSAVFRWSDSDAGIIPVT
jgi:hypothetical protein